MTPEMYKPPKEQKDAVQKRETAEVSVEPEAGSGKKVRKARKKS